MTYRGARSVELVEGGWATYVGDEVRGQLERGQLVRDLRREPNNLWSGRIDVDGKWWMYFSVDELCPMVRG